jgi:Holliday junction resolvasome RuvABC endonuclease subunit
MYCNKQTEDNQMLKMNDAPYRILGIDPSTTSVGIAVIDVDERIGVPHVLWTETIKRNQVLKEFPWLLDVYDERSAAIYAYKRYFYRLLDHFEPDFVTIESSYLGRNPGSYKALSEVIKTFGNTVMEWDCTIPFYSITPSEVKNTLGVSGKSGEKGEMRSALLHQVVPFTAEELNLTQISEHEIDAVAVALSTAVRLIQTR